MKNETKSNWKGVPLTLIIVKKSRQSSSRLGFQVAEENLLCSMMFTLAVLRIFVVVGIPLGDMVVV
jgi:hypothetical protein